MANAREDAYIKALHDVATHLLGEDWYIVDPVSGAQAAERIATEIKNEYPKRDMSRVERWRCKHRKCIFCKHSEPLAPMDIYHGNDIWCAAKKCAKNRDAVRPFCTLFSLEKEWYGDVEK